MALTWQWRSTQLDAYYTKSLAKYSTPGQANAALVASGVSGVFGGSLLDVVTYPNKRHTWAGYDSAPVASAAMSILVRVMPVGTGNPAAQNGLFQIGDPRANDCYGGLSFSITTLSKVFLYGARGDTGAVNVNSAFTNALTLTANVPTDIWVIWDGTTAANKIELWQAQNGIAPTLLSTLTASSTYTRTIGMCPMIMGHDTGNAALNSKFYINEIAIFDTAFNPATVYGARTDFIPTPAYEGYNSTALAASNVKQGVAYGPGPGSLTGTLKTEIGTAFIG